MSKNPQCGIRFAVIYPPFPTDMACELDRWHDSPHESDGFVWGPKDQTKDFQTQRIREAVEKRKNRTRTWYGKLRGKR